MMKEQGSICKCKSTGRSRVPEEAVNSVRAAFHHNPRKSTRRASRELSLPQSTVWRILRKRIKISPYRLHLLQALKEDDKVKRFNLCCGIQNRIENVDDFLTRLTFSDEIVFHLSGKVNGHNVRVWGTEAPYVSTEHEGDSPKWMFFVHTGLRPFLFCGEHGGKDHVSGNAVGVARHSATGRRRRLYFAAGWCSASLSPRPEVLQWTPPTALDWTFCPKNWLPSWGVATQIPRHHSMWFFLVGIRQGPFCTTSCTKPSGMEGVHQPLTLTWYSRFGMNWTRGLMCACDRRGCILNICRIKNQMCEFLNK